MFDLEKHRISVLFVEKQWDLYIDNKEKTNRQFFRNFINQKLSLPFHPQHMRGIKSIFKYWVGCRGSHSFLFSWFFKFPTYLPFLLKAKTRNYLKKSFITICEQEICTSGQFHMSCWVQKPTNLDSLIKRLGAQDSE